MGSPLGFKIYAGKELMATTRHAEDAAAVAAVTSGAVVKFSGRIIWREGKEAVRADESYDQAAEIMRDRIGKHRMDARAKYNNAMVQAAVPGYYEGKKP